MKKDTLKIILKCVAFFIIFVLVITYVGYKFELYPVVEIEEEQNEEVKESEEFEISVDESREFIYYLISLITDEPTTENSSKDILELEYHKGKVTKVVDGDTLWVKMDDSNEKIKVRLIGIDTPESVVDEEASGKKNCEEGVIASDRTKEILKDANNIVYLEYDVEETDQYGRVLAYVYVEIDNEYQMLQDILLAEGMCKTMTIQPNVKYADHFVELQRKAQSELAGFWGTEFDN